jgi:hypothetical protein
VFRTAARTDQDVRQQDVHDVALRSTAFTDGTPPT